MPTSHWFSPSPTEYSSPGLWSRSRSSTGSWDSSSQGSSPDQSDLSQGAWLGAQRRDRGQSSHGSVWGLYCNNDVKMGMVVGEEERGADVFWQDFEIKQVGLGAELQQVGKPDLLDTLVMEDQDEKKRLLLKTQYHQITQLPSLENLLKLLELEQMYSNAPQGRPITGGSIQPPPPPTYIMNQEMRMKKIMMMTKSPAHAVNLVHHATHTLKFPPVNFKAPPPHHPPAVPASFHHHASHDANQTIPPPAFSPPSLPLSGSVTAIHLRVEEARWQFQALEKERKMTEAALVKQNPGKRISSSNSVQIPRLPLSPNKLDKLVIDCLREQARVVTLLDKLEKIEGRPSMSGLHSIMTMWRNHILVVMTIRRKERLDRAGMDIGEELGKALANMNAASRKARTVLWVLMVGGPRHGQED